MLNFSIYCSHRKRKERITPREQILKEVLFMSSKKAELLMVSVTLAWGSSYLLMKVGLNGIGPFNLIALRFGIAFVFMTLAFLPKFRKLTRATLLKGLLAGVILFLLFTGMVCGVNYTTASTAGFLTSTTVVLVPILESFLKRKLPEKSMVASICIAICGLFLLTATDGLALDKGALLCLMGALFYAIYIIVLDKIAKKEDAFLISIIQLGVASALGAVAMCLFETPSLPTRPVEWGAVIGLGLVCSAYGFVVQPIARKYAAPDKFGLIFALEPVFSAILSFLFLHEVLDFRGYLGAALILSSVVFSELMTSGRKVTAPKKHPADAHTVCR